MVLSHGLVVQHSETSCFRTTRRGPAGGELESGRFLTTLERQVGLELGGELADGRALVTYLMRNLHVTVGEVSNLLFFEQILLKK